jgi:3-oxoacyl-[acyl-carrier protein] reductase
LKRSEKVYELAFSPFDKLRVRRLKQFLMLRVEARGEERMFDLTGKTALVTGASGGIGGAIAKALHGQGAKVVLSGTRAEALEKVKAELGERAVIAPANLSDAASVEALPKAAEDAAGASIDILVNNAGITRDNLFMRMKDEEWNQVLAVNLTAAFRLSRAVLRPMMKKRWGRIVQITSIVGATGNPGQGNYAAAKAGLIGMTKSLAAEVASRNITVNAVAPGFIQTAMTDALTDQQKQAIAERIPAGRMGSPAEIAAAVIYLASQEAAYVTGETLHVNGGMAML